MQILKSKPQASTSQNKNLQADNAKNTATPPPKDLTDSADSDMRKPGVTNNIRHAHQESKIDILAQQLATRPEAEKDLTEEQAITTPLVSAALQQMRLIAKTPQDTLHTRLREGITLNMSLAQLQEFLQRFQALAVQQGVKLSDQSYMPFAFLLRPNNTGQVTFFSGEINHDGSNQIAITHHNNYPLLGLYGGVGTDAGVNFVRNIVQLWPTMPKTRQYDDHQRPFDILLLSCSATPDRTKKIEALHDKHISGPEKALHGGLKMLISCGATVTCVACNTAHFWLDDAALQKSLGQHACKNLSVLDALVDKLKTQNTDNAVIVLSTLGTQKSGLYQNALTAQGINIQPLTDAETEKVHDIIYTLIKTGHPSEAALALTKILNQYPNSTIALCCTELGLSLNAKLTPALHEEGRLIDNNIVSPKALLKKLMGMINPADTAPALIPLSETDGTNNIHNDAKEPELLNP